MSTSVSHVAAAHRSDHHQSAAASAPKHAEHKHAAESKPAAHVGRKVDVKA